jgi:Carboxypeptidase regulatory-like domain/TonB-dependent Receptor Plug Domain
MRMIRSFLQVRCLRRLCAGNTLMLPSLLVFGMLFALAPAFAQTITGTVRGTVTDPSGAVVAGASVIATNTATNVKTGTVTNQDGDYNIQFLPIGSYVITVTSSGFDTTSIGPFSLEIDQIAKISVALKVGSGSEKVEVSAENSPLLQTENSTLQATITSQTLSDLPLNGLNFQTATLFVPGVVNPGLASMGGQDGNERNVDWYGSPSFNGNRGQANNYVLDGVEMNETLNNLAAYNPAPDSIQEMHVITGNADAEYGNVNGGEVLVVTKGGTNQIHGSAYDYLENNNMAGTPWSQSYIYGLPDQPYTQNQFGATIGGPIKKNKIFLFGDYLGFRYHHGGQAAATVATNDMRTGNFSELYGSAFGGIQLYNNQNGAGYSNATPYGNCAVAGDPCNQIPVMNPVAQFLFSHQNVYPASNRSPIPGLGDLDNYQGPQKGHTVNDQGDARVDFHINDRNTLMGR